MSKIVPKEEKISKSEKVHLPMLRASDKPKEIRLGGTAVQEDGSLAKHRYFDFLNIDFDDYSDMSFTEEEALKIRGHLAKMSTGSTSMVPMICSPLCAWRMRCEFYKMNRAPFGRACLWEVNLLREWGTSYFNEYEVDPNNFTEVGMINELAEIEIYLWRLNQSLAKPENAELVTDNVVGMSREGEPIIQKQLSVFLEAKERLYARKSKLIKLMVGDRQEKYKREAALKVREEADPSSTMAELRGKLEKLQREVTRQEISVAEKSGKIIDATITLPEPPKVITAEDLIGSDE